MYNMGGAFRNKAFTLIELLAVIVILAIIALIAVPIILNIINDSKDQSIERSAELYEKAVLNAVMQKQLDGKTIVPDGTYTVQENGRICYDSFCLPVEVDGERPKASESTVTLTGGKVTAYTLIISGIQKTKVPKQSETHYYSWSTGNVGDLLSSIADKTTTPLIDHDFYLRLDSKDEKTITSTSVCFKNQNGIEYCLKGNDSTAYSENKEILKQALGESYCRQDNGYYCCDNGVLDTVVMDDGYITVSDYSNNCYVSNGGVFYCGTGTGFFCGE